MSSSLRSPSLPVPKLALVDDHPVFLEGLSSVLRRRGTFTIVGVGCTADEAVAIAQKSRPDVMLIDLSIPGGLRALREIVENCGDVRMIVLTGIDDTDAATQALDAGAKGYVNKGAEAEELISAVDSVCRGETYVTPRMLAQIVRPRQPLAQIQQFDELTRREETIIRMVANGLTNREIAAELGLSQVTVRNHVGRVMSKLNARNRVQACVLACEFLPGLQPRSGPTSTACRNPPSSASRQRTSTSV